MKIHIHGAAQTVTGSQYIIDVNGCRILLECGLFQGKRAESFSQNRIFPFDPREIDAVILSHAHIDHSGNLPNLVKNGYEGPIFTTRATASLADVMLQDSGHIQEADAQFINRRRASHGEPPVEPIYTREDAIQVARLFQPVDYEETFEPASGVTARLVDAGHILGSAGICLDMHENGSTKRLWFSGDIGRRDLPLIPDPVLPQDPDYLMMECTYGDKPHASIEEAYQEFCAVVKKTLRRGGKVIIPAFAVGRTQELVFFLNQMVEAGIIPRVPVFVDSPLAVKATEIFKEYPDFMDKETHEFVRRENQPPLDFKGLHYVESVEESKKINNLQGPAVIISASGMAETGRILHHLRNNIEDERNTILIVSWQAPYTLGRRLAEREKQVKIFGEIFYRRAEVETIGGLSAHAGQNMLMEYARAARGKLKKLILIHGEQRAASAFEEKLKAEQIGPVIYPTRNETVEL